MSGGYALLIIFVLLQLADVGTTYVGLKRGYDEANFLPGVLIDRFGFWRAALGIKGIAILLAGLVTALVPHAWVFTGILNALGAGVLVNNLLLLGAGDEG